MLDSSRVHEAYGETCKPSWVQRYTRALHPIRHFIYQAQLLSQGQLRFRGLDVYLNSPDRVVLEDEILLFLASYTSISRVLFVGCDWYTKSYRKIFKQQEYWTIEPDVSRACYGSSKHIVAPLENLTLHCPENYFDLIVCNGVLGYGLNTVAAANQAIASCFHCLSPNGILVIGWNNVPQSSPFPASCEALERFTPYVFPAMSTSQYAIDTANHHTFNFYCKPTAYRR